MDNTEQELSQGLPTKIPTKVDQGHRDFSKKTIQKHPIPLLVRGFQLYFQVVGRLLPSLAGALAYKLWFGTRRFKTPDRELKWQASARIYQLPHPQGPLMMYSWGEDKVDAPKVVLLHGWNGRATQMGAFIEPLLEAGFQVCAFDAPGHGGSPGNSTNLLIVADALRSVVDSLGAVQSVIAHSFGAMALARALRKGLPVNNAVCISAPAQADLLVNSFCDSLRIPGPTRKNLINRFHHNFGKDIWSRISALENAKKLSTPALIVHDEKDAEVEVAHAHQLAAAWPGAQLMLTQGLGHRRILRHNKTIQAIVHFVGD